MTVRALTQEAKKLSFTERWELIEELMEMSADERADVALTPAQAADLDRRLAEARPGKERLIPGEEAVAMIRKHLRQQKKKRS